MVWSWSDREEEGEPTRVIFELREEGTQARFRRRYGKDKWEEMQRALSAVAAAVPMAVRKPV